MDEELDPEDRQSRLLEKAFDSERSKQELEGARSAPITQAQWSDFRCKHEAEVSAYEAAEVQPLLDDVKTSLRDLPLAPGPTVNRDRQSPFSVLKTQPVQRRFENYLVPEPLVQQGGEIKYMALMVVCELMEGVGDRAKADAIRDLFHGMHLSAHLAGRTEGLAMDSASTKALFNPLMAEVTRVAPHLHGLLQHPSGPLNAPTSYQLHWPPPPVVAETLDSPCATMAIVRAQGVDRSKTFVSDVIFSHRNIPPDDLQPIPGHKALFDSSAKPEDRLAVLKADRLMFALHRAIVRLRSTMSHGLGSFNIVAGGVGWDNTQDALRSPGRG